MAAADILAAHDGPSASHAAGPVQMDVLFVDHLLHLSVGAADPESDLNLLLPPASPECAAGPNCCQVSS